MTLMFSEEDLLPLSALQHLAFCERQWGLIHLEGVWDENRLTAEGRVLHEKTHQAEAESRAGVRTARGLRLRSLRLGLSGQADVVEFHRLIPIEGPSRGNPAPGTAVRLPGQSGWWRPVPVEYKRGRPKAGSEDEIQLCAQTLCLEEMLGATIPVGALYYGQPRRRKEVEIGLRLRTMTEMLAGRLHELARQGSTPSARYEKKCDSCSLIDRCLPKTLGRRGGIQRYLAEFLAPDPGKDEP